MEEKTILTTSHGLTGISNLQEMYRSGKIRLRAPLNQQRFRGALNKSKFFALVCSVSIPCCLTNEVLFKIVILCFF